MVHPSAADPRALVDAETIGAFQRDGAVALRGVFSAWIEPLRAGVAANRAAPSPDARVYQGEDGGGRFFGDYCNWARIPDFRAFVEGSPAGVVGAALMGAREVRLFHEHVLVKEAAAGVATPWHQDAPYYSVAAEKSVSLWIPLDPVPRERTLEFVSGSHKWGKLFRPERFNGAALNEGETLQPVPDIEADRAAFPILGWALEPGDAVAFDFRTLHGAPANDSPTAERRAFSLRLVGEGARFVREAGRVTSPPFPDVALAHGAPLEGPAFPLLFSRE